MIWTWFFLEHLIISESPSFLAGTMPSCFGNLELLGMCYTWLLKLLALVPQAIGMASRGISAANDQLSRRKPARDQCKSGALRWICSNFSLSDMQTNCQKACYVWSSKSLLFFLFSWKHTICFHYLFSQIYFTHAAKMSSRVARYRLFHGRHVVGLAAISLDHGVQSQQQLSKFCTEWIALPGVEMGGSGLYKGYFTYWSAWRSIR